jgi:hypothetical protein
MNIAEGREGLQASGFRLQASGFRLQASGLRGTDGDGSCKFYARISRRIFSPDYGLDFEILGLDFNVLGS